MSADKGGLWLTSVDTGLEIRFVAVGPGLTEIAFITAHGDGVDGHRQFAGTLPHGLSIRQTRREIERKLGSPATLYGFENKVDAEYPQLGVRLEFQGKTPRDPAGCAFG